MLGKAVPRSLERGDKKIHHSGAMLVWFPWETPHKAQPALDEPLIETLAQADPLSRTDVEDAVDGPYYPDGVYWRYASS
jgi:hypothetical protein